MPAMNSIGDIRLLPEAVLLKLLVKSITNRPGLRRRSNPLSPNAGIMFGNGGGNLTHAVHRGLITWLRFLIAKFVLGFRCLESLCHRKKLVG